MTNQEIKKEGRAGLFFAYDANHNLTAADDAITGVPYTCPICGCAMHATKTKSGKRIFARNPNTEHTKKRCITIESRGVERSFAGIDPHKFIMSLCHATPRKQSGEKSGSETEKNTSNTNDTMNQDNEQDCTLLSFRSLKQLAESGVKYLNPNDTQGGHKVCEYIMTYNYGMEFFSDPNFELGERIVTARFQYIESKVRAIAFSMFHGGYVARFQLVFPNRNTLNDYMQKFGYWEEVLDKHRFVKLYDDQDVLIASDDWKKVKKPACRDRCYNKHGQYCVNCLGLYEAHFTNSKQLYLEPPESDPDEAEDDD